MVGGVLGPVATSYLNSPTSLPPSLPLSHTFPHVHPLSGILIAAVPGGEAVRNICEGRVCVFYICHISVTCVRAT